MSFRFQKRVNLGKGLGLNLSKSGVSSSYRGKWGSIGKTGISFKTGIKGLNYKIKWNDPVSVFIGLCFVSIFLIPQIIWLFIKLTYVFYYWLTFVPLKYIFIKTKILFLKKQDCENISEKVENE